MKTFLAVYLAPAAAMREMMATTTPEQAQAGMDAWMRWADANKASIADLGSPLGKTRRVTSGGVSDVSNDMAGYSLVKAESLAEVDRIFRDHPHLSMPGATIDIMECLEMPGS